MERTIGNIAFFYLERIMGNIAFFPILERKMFPSSSFWKQDEDTNLRPLEARDKGFEFQQFILRKHDAIYLCRVCIIFVFFLLHVYSISPPALLLIGAHFPVCWRETAGHPSDKMKNAKKEKVLKISFTGRSSTINTSSSTASNNSSVSNSIVSNRGNCTSSIRGNEKYERG